VYLAIERVHVTKESGALAWPTALESRAAAMRALEKIPGSAPWTTKYSRIIHDMIVLP
jgi:hypothetical protein